MHTHRDETIERDSAAGGHQSSMAFIETPRLRHLGRGALLSLVAGSVFAGVLLTLTWIHVVGPFIEEVADDVIAAIPASGFPNATLTGPAGTVVFPPREPTVVHVWLQGCADCMPAFEAQKRHVDAGAYEGIPVVNVAFGRADTSWATSYGVDRLLVFDDGSAVVRPLGIGTFTTFLVDEEGDIRFRARPDEVGFVNRLHGALVATRSDASEQSRRATSSR